MSGISGIHYNNSLENSTDIQNMMKSIVHRGPDEEGFISVNSKDKSITELGFSKYSSSLIPISNYTSTADLYLGHRNLILDAYSEYDHQPISNDNKNIWLVYDGEIYNYNKIKNNLNEYKFKYNTDTETILYAYEKWDISCLSHFNGNWSFVIYDSTKNILFGARDRFGVKPLYYTHNNSFFAFCSEAKGILSIQKMSRNINIGASAAYLKNGLLNFDGDTFFNNIHELPNSYYFIFDIANKSLNLKRYYDLPFYDIWEDFNEEKSKTYIDGVKKRIFDSVKLRLNSKNSIGACLSGGMDSSSISCIINTTCKNDNSFNKKLALITSCCNNSDLDESNWAKLVVDQITADWHKVYPTEEELKEDIFDLIYSQDFPFGSTSIYAQYRVMKIAKEAGIPILFDGQGGDELFTGYTPYYETFYSEALINNANSVLSSEKQFLCNSPLQENYIDELIKRKTQIIPILKGLIPKTIKQSIKKILLKDILNQDYTNKKENIYTKYTNTTLNKMLYNYMFYTSLPTLLRYADRNAMRFSIISRFPFVDDTDLVEYVFSIPSIYKIHNGWSKYLLRESMNNIIPDKIKNRTDKIGFETPEYQWLIALKPIVFESIDPSIKKIINIDLFKNNWDNLFLNKNNLDIAKIWRYINYILWFKLFKVSI